MVVAMIRVMMDDGGGSCGDGDNDDNGDGDKGGCQTTFLRMCP